MKENSSDTRRYHAKSGYVGNTARDYDRKRKKRRKWRLELSAVDQMVSRFDAGSSVLDLPLGTGRFLSCYEAGKHRVLGLDISQDMLAQAEAKIRAAKEVVIHTALADAETIPLADQSVDYIVCIRLLNWVTDPAMEKIVAEFKRVARKGIVLGFRTYRPMTGGEFFLLGLRDIIPFPRHIKKWMIGAHRFYKRAQGKLLSIVRKPAENAAAKPLLNKAAVFSGSNHYDKAKMMEKFQGMGMTVLQEIPIDKSASYGKRRVNPYSIYYLGL